VNPRFVAIASDPQLIPGVHHYCDEWCTYCDVTHRCLAFRCTEDWRTQRRRTTDEPPFATRDEAIAFTRQLAEVEGGSTEELDALIAAGPARSGIQTADPLADMAWQYGIGAAVLLAQLARHPPYDAIAGDPSPMDVVVWFHLRIYMKLFRALVARERTAAGMAEKTEEATGCAKIALVSIQRSRAALPLLLTERNAPRVARLEALLGALESGIDDRFPQARGFVRVGLDVPAAA
jgi:hypothetical protein